MSKRTLGSVVKEARNSSRLTQRGLAAAIDVKASHVAYIENGHRRPSISLITRLGVILGLDTKELFMLAYPEAKGILRCARPSIKGRVKAWPRFLSNQSLLRRHAITRMELRVLKEVAKLEDVARPGHFVFVLNAMRQAVAQC